MIINSNERTQYILDFFYSNETKDMRLGKKVVKLLIKTISFIEASRDIEDIYSVLNIKNRSRNKLYYIDIGKFELVFKHRANKNIIEIIDFRPK